MFNLKYYIVGILCLIPLCSFAQNDNKNKDKVENMEQVVVTATRTPKMLKDVPVLTRVITSKDIERIGATTLTQALETELPGIEFGRHGSQTRVNLQGFESNSILFLVDGEKISYGEQSNIDYMRIPVNDIERIEIVKGATSSLYGSNAVGGVVNIILKQSQRPFFTSYNVDYSTLKEFNNHLALGGKYKNLQNYTSLNFSREGGFKIPYVNGKVETLDTSYIYNFDTRFVWTPNNKIRLSVGGNLYFKNRLTPIYDPKTRLSSSLTNDVFYGTRFNANLRYNITDKTVMELSAAFDGYDKNIVNKFDYDYSLFDHSNTNFNTRLQVSHAFKEKNVLTGGINFQTESLFSRVQLKNKRRYANTFAAYAQYDVELFKNFTTVVGVRMDKHSTFGLNFSPKVSLMYKLWRFNLRASYGNGFAAPTLKNLYHDFEHTFGGVLFRIHGNTNLKPEKSHNFNVGFEYTQSRVYFSFLGFYNIFHNKIIENRYIGPDGWENIVWANYNGKSHIRGYDVMLKLNLPLNFSLRAGYTFTDNYNPIKLSNGKTINNSYTRPHMFRLRVDQHFDITDNLEGNIGITDKFASKLTYPYDETGNGNLIQAKSEAYNLVDLNVKLKYKQKYNFSLIWSNIGGYRPYERSFDSPINPGTSVIFKFAVNL